MRELAKIALETRVATVVVQLAPYPLLAEVRRGAVPVRLGLSVQVQDNHTVVAWNATKVRLDAIVGPEV